eukprot:TRINITY_DN5848_c1_g1_i1.p1 TRINITY_DN5848_c1_g1~~TRINITY_DN5848_c1_g1_i1.p1  ORF type:complete len:351 (-),score=73.34 TRINITY_DN5848_c1_g1_i1:29-1081(-)
MAPTVRGRQAEQRKRKVLSLVVVTAFVVVVLRRFARTNVGDTDASALRGAVESARKPLCHPSLSRLRSSDGRDVVLIGTLPLDLDGVYRDLVDQVLRALRPDMIVVEGTWKAGASSMLHSGKWKMEGTQLTVDDWRDIGDALPVKLKRPQRRGFFSFLKGIGQPPLWPDRSYVPLKVGNWAKHLRMSVGGDIASAVTAGAATGVPVHFLGPEGADLQGHVQVSVLAQQAARELLQQEASQGMRLPNSEIDAALLRAEARLRADAERWLRDARGETRRILSLLQDRGGPQDREDFARRLSERAAAAATNVLAALRSAPDLRKAAIVLPVEHLAGVEEHLSKAGYAYVSDCV